jgi:hypothetical protein
MDQRGRAYALFKTKIQGPELSRRAREFSSKNPQLELLLKVPSQLNEDLTLRTFAKAALDAGSNVVLIASELGIPDVIVAGQLRAILMFWMQDLIANEPQILYKERGQYKIIWSRLRTHQK